MMRVHDIVTVGGGIGGSSFAKAMAERGYRVLIVERETRFKDRVRGEFVFPWGVAEAIELGVLDTLIAVGAHQPAWWQDYAGSNAQPPRDFALQTPQRVRALAMYHPRMQEALLAAAVAAGAEIRRGVRVTDVELGSKPVVSLDGDGGRESVAARLVVGADGRASLMRKWCGFDSRADLPGNIIAGVLVEHAAASADTSICLINSYAARMVLYFPQAGGAGRAYLVSRADGGVRLHGDTGFERFIEECVNSGLPADLLAGAHQAGPLATFDGAESWVDHPYNRGCALIGDAAATSDPTWGQGLSLTLRDARALRDALLATEDWDAAGHAYASEHASYYGRVRTAESWYTQLFLEPGPRADALRARVFPQLSSDASPLPDTLIAGPDLAPPTAEQRARLFGDSLAPTVPA